jgi:hypothetical protein
VAAVEMANLARQLRAADSAPPSKRASKPRRRSRS